MTDLTAFSMASAFVGLSFATALPILQKQAVKAFPPAAVGVWEPPPVHRTEPLLPVVTVHRAALVATTTVTAEMVASCVIGPCDSPRPAPSPAPRVSVPRSRYGARRRLGFTWEG
jgi:hypothetical protein